MTDHPPANSYFWQNQTICNPHFTLLLLHWDFIAHLEQQQQIYKNQVYTTSTISQKSLKTNKKTKKSSEV